MEILNARVVHMQPVSPQSIPLLLSQLTSHGVHLGTGTTLAKQYGLTVSAANAGTSHAVR